MNNDKPVQLAQKIDYLHQKIDFLHTQSRLSGLFELKMKFIEYIDTSIERIYQLEGKKPGSREVVHKKYEEYHSVEQNKRQKERLDSEKQRLSHRLKDLDEREKQMQVESLRLQLENSKILKNSILKETNAKEYELKQYITDLEKKIRSQEREIERLIKLNSMQAKQMEGLKEERNRAEKRELQWKQRYDSDIGVLQTYKQKKTKYLYRNEEGLRVIRTITNVTTQRKGYERLFFCDLPVRFHVIKITYGIKVGMVTPNRDIIYFQQVSLYEKEDMEITLEGGQLSLLYIKRKVTIKLDKYKLAGNQVVIMLFGRGDSVGIDETA